MQISDYVHAQTLTPTTILDALSDRRALSVPFLTEEARKSLLAAAMRYSYRKLEERTGNGNVTQHIYRAEATFLQKHIGTFGSVLRGYMCNLLHEHEAYMFYQPLDPNEISLQWYPTGYGGISPHVDGKRFLNLVILVVLQGRGDLFVCDDRSGAGARQVDTTPGNLIMLPANGFLEDENTPFHYVENVRSKRYIFGMRQDGSRIRR